MSQRNPEAVLLSASTTVVEQFRCFFMIQKPKISSL